MTDSKDGFWADDKLWNDANLALGRYLTAWGEVEGVVTTLFGDLAIPDPQVASIVFGSYDNSGPSRSCDRVS